MKKRIIFRILGLLLCVVPPLLAAVDQFPMMTTAGKVSMAFVFVVALCAIPLFKHLKALLRSPSAWVMWMLIFLFCAAMRAIIDEFYIISMIGFVSSLLGAGCFRIAKGKKEV